MHIQLWILLATTIYQAIALLLENQTPPPGQRIDIGGYKLHLYGSPPLDATDPRVLQEPWDLKSTMPTIVLDHSLGGIEGYLLIDALSELAPVYAYDRAGYGWSDFSPHRRTSDRIVDELDTLLTRAQIKPPYVLVGDSFGSYNMRLYAHRFPKKVVGLVLTDGLHESGMLAMPWQLKAVHYLFISGFLMSIVGSILGIVRVFNTVGMFHLIKPSLRRCSPQALKAVTRSFCRPKHWITMTQELWFMATSGQQIKTADSLGDLPLVSIKARGFFLPSPIMSLLPLAMIERLREGMHKRLLQLSTRSLQIKADHSDHFVWVEQPQVMIDAVKLVINQ
ncbi:MAG: alpha/beta hydrolase [Cyanobacteria bacterium P01_F01_bin.150]